MFSGLVTDYDFFIPEYEADFLLFKQIQAFKVQLCSLKNAVKGNLISSDSMYVC